MMIVLKPMVILTWWWSKWSESEFMTLKKYGHHNCWFTLYNEWVWANRRKNFGNGWPNLHNYAYALLGTLGNGLIRITDHKNLNVDTTIFHLSCIIIELWPKNEISVMADIICIIMHSICKLLGPLGNGLIRIIDHENLGVDTKIFHLSCIIIELWTKNQISVMADLICILLNFPKGTNLASSGFLISNFHRYKNCKKTLWGLQNHVHPLYCWTILAKILTYC